MFAIIAAVLFGLALILDLANASLGAAITYTTLLLAGLLCIALHMAGIGVSARGRSFAWRRARRR
jgi:hypothetical protein